MSTGAEQRRSSLERAAALVLAGVVTGWTFAGLDIWRRTAGHQFPLGRHVAGVLALYALAGAALGLVAALASTLEGALHRRLEPSRPRLALAMRVGAAAVVSALLGKGTAFWLFTGGRARTLSMAKWAPWLGVLGLALAGAALALLLHASAKRLRHRVTLGPLLGLGVVLAGAALLLWADLHVLVALYARLHTLLEVAAAVAVFSVIALIFAVVAQRFARLRTAVSIGAAASLSWLSVFMAFDAPKEWLLHGLRHVWREPIYAGRMLSRAHAVEAYLRNPGGWSGAAESGLDRLREHYDIGNTSLNPAWEQGPVESPALTAKLAELRRRDRPPNIVVFYVDTLRDDVARDPQVMPNLDRLAKRSLDFRRAYTTGSDTMNALPALTSGRYATVAPGPNDLLEVARRTKVKTVLAIPQSAHEFLSKERPVFRFDETLHVTDFTPARTDVWGYGADRSSALELAERSSEWMKAHKDERFLLWVFNFDVHNWRELSEKHVTETALRLGMPQGPGMARYRIAARGVDEGLGRLLTGLEEAGLEQDTIVLFVSDHGESVGRDGFWVHAIFLWEVLVRIPMVLHVPGLPPTVVEREASLVDVAPTLGRYLDPKLDVRGYHGVDLLSALVDGPAAPRRPLLMVGAAQDGLRRVGMVEPGNPLKLVLQIEAGTPELYDRFAADPDWDDLSERHERETVEMLSRLVRSPVFPRKAGQGDEGKGDELAEAPK